MPSERDTYTCAACGGTFVSDRPDEEAQAEYEELFTEAERAADERAVVCDDCWRAMMQTYPPSAWRTT